MSLARSVSNAAPAGVVLPFAGAAAPNGWLMCYGQAVSRATYAALFAAIGTAHGTAANRLTTAGSGANGATLGAAGGAETHTLSLAQMPAHSHAVSGATASASGGYSDLRASGSAAGVAPTTASQGNGNAHNNTQPTLVVHYIIKT